MAGDRVYRLRACTLRLSRFFDPGSARGGLPRGDPVEPAARSDVYLGVVPLTLSTSGLAISGDGPTVDWLVVMRRLRGERDARNRFARWLVEVLSVDRVAATLGAFYAHAPRVQFEPEHYLVTWQKALNDNCRVLFDARLGLPQGAVERIARSGAAFSLNRPEPAPRKDPREAFCGRTWRPETRTYLVA